MSRYQIRSTEHVIVHGTDRRQAMSPVEAQNLKVKTAMATVHAIEANRRADGMQDQLDKLAARLDAEPDDQATSPPDTAPPTMPASANQPTGDPAAWRRPDYADDTARAIVATWRERGWRI